MVICGELNPIRISDYSPDKVIEFLYHPDWLFIPTQDGAAMQRVNQYRFYSLGFILHPLREIKEGAKLMDIYFNLYHAQNWLDFLLRNQFVPIVVSRQACQQLYTAINRVLPDPNKPDMEKVLDFSEGWGITNALETFETVFAAELQTFATYFVDQKGAYSTGDLIERAEIIFPESVRKTIPDSAKKDIRQAGRALAFDLPTAAGFHIVRATESVIRKYYDTIVGSAPKKRDWGTYIEDLKKSGADAKILAAVDQMRNLDRNPLIHPEEVLTEEDALALFGIAQSAIVRMVGDIQAREKAKTAALSPPSST